MSGGARVWIRALAAPAAALLLIAATARAAAPACPPSTAYFQTYSPATAASIASPTYDQTFTDSWTAHAVFDRNRATLSFSGSSGGRMSANLLVSECFDVVGVPPGTAVDAFLDWQVDGSSFQNCGGSGCGIRFEVTLTAGGGSVVADADISGPSSSLTRTLATTLTRPLHFVAATPVAVTFFIDYGTGPGQDGAEAHVSGAYAVRGLPPGVHAIASSGADVTPTRSTSWGALKLLYR